MSKPERMIISCEGGCLVPKSPGPPGVVMPRPQRFYNWGLTDEGRPDPQAIDGLDVPFDAWHIGLAVDGTVRVDGPEEAARWVDKMRRDKQLQVEAKLGWDRCPPKKQNQRKRKPKVKEPAGDPPKDND